MKLIPATIVTGFLGAGKTTLLKRILGEAHGQKIAVIENEFGEENIDNEILLEHTTEQIVQLSNGCVCCTIREDLRATLTTLAEKKNKGELNFERVIIETTGLADPGPVAQTFFMDDVVAESFLLDSIITLVDAKHGMLQLDTNVEAQRQVGFADLLCITKSDLITPEVLGQLQQRLRQMNPRAAQKMVNFGKVELTEVLDLFGFNLNDKLTIDPKFLEQAKVAPKPHVHDEHCNHDHDHDHDEHHHHHDDHHHAHGDEHKSHLDAVKSFVFKSSKPFDSKKFESFLGVIVDIYGPKLLRYKGILYMKDTSHKVIFQGVHQMMGSDLGKIWAADEERMSKIVIIGIDLPKDLLLKGLEQCCI